MVLYDDFIIKNKYIVFLKNRFSTYLNHFNSPIFL